MTNVHKFTKAIINFQLEDKLRRVMNFVTFLSITKNYDSIKGQRRKVSSQCSTNADTQVAKKSQSPADVPVQR